MKARPRVFLDASVFVAAAGSSTGGSAYVLEICGKGHAAAVSSRLVLLEAERNIGTKLGENALLRFYQQLGSLDLEIVQPETHEIDAQSQIISQKDAHVLAAAIKGEVDFLLTLDRRHFFSKRVLQAELPFRIQRPGDFLKEWVQRMA